MNEYEYIKLIGERIRIAREKAGLTQEKLAKRLNIGKRTLINYENGRTEPTLSLLMKIANICNVDYNWLLALEKKEELIEVSYFPSLEAYIAYHEMQDKLREEKLKKRQKYIWGGLK